MSRAATSTGTKIRSRIEEGQLHDAALRDVEGFRDLPLRDRRAMVKALYRRAGSGSLEMVKTP